MIAFEVRLDGEKVCMAGVGETGVLSAIVSWVRRGAHPAEQETGSWVETLSCEVGGLMHQDGADYHVKWLSQSLGVGQQVTITVVEAPEVDRAPAAVREDPERTRRARRRYFETLQREFEPPRGK